MDIIIHSVVLYYVMLYGGHGTHNHNLRQLAFCRATAIQYIYFAWGILILRGFNGQKLRWEISWKFPTATLGDVASVIIWISASTLIVFSHMRLSHSFVFC